MLNYLKVLKLHILRLNFFIITSNLQHLKNHILLIIFFILNGYYIHLMLTKLHEIMYDHCEDF